MRMRQVSDRARLRWVLWCLSVLLACERHPAMFVACGDGRVQDFEDCDGENTGGATCWTRGYDLGVLRCTDECTFDEGDCRDLPPQTCGDGVLQAGEYCDGDDLGEVSCERLGFSGGRLSCADCAFDTEGCHGEPDVCGDGVRQESEACDGDDLGDATCEFLGHAPGTLTCAMNCTFDPAGCGDPCAWTGDGAQGCAFVAVSMANPQLKEPFHDDFGLLISNPQAVAVRVRVQGPNVDQERLVSAHGAELFLLPVLDFLQTAGAAPTLLTSHFRPGLYRAARGQGAYFISSDLPVRAAQFNPFHHMLATGQGYTADASLLIPVRDLGTRAVVMTRSNWFMDSDEQDLHCNYPGNLVVVAVEDDTRVTVIPRAPLAEGDDVSATPRGVPLTRILDRGDVLQLMTLSDFLDCPVGEGTASVMIDGEKYCTGGLAHDLTGSQVTADRPVAVWGGHNLAFIPFDLWAGDLLEEVMPPLDTLGTHHVVALTELPSARTAANFIRVLAVEDHTNVEFSPPVHAPVTLDAGEFLEFPATARNHFEVISSAPVLVGKFVLSADYFRIGFGDPSFGLVVPTHRFRTSYRTALPASFLENFVQIVAPLPTTPAQRIWLDDQPFNPSDYTPIGESGFGVILWQYALERSPRQVHIFSRDPAITFTVELFGYASYQSYLLPVDW
ncbi:IgGFc-binding protein [Myxococcota bacterium]|nr:IgGFc-binding protein [Myxococcota bacterium]